MRTYANVPRLIWSGLIAIYLLIPSAAEAADSYKTVDGITAYLGVLPADAVLAHAPEHTDRHMHGGVPRGKAQRHITIALFDSTSGQRINDARVSTRVQEVGLGMTSKELQPMLIDSTVTYGNYFQMSGSGPYRIEVDVRRHGGREKPITVRFDYSQRR